MIPHHYSGVQIVVCLVSALTNVDSENIFRHISLTIKKIRDLLGGLAKKYLKDPEYAIFPVVCLAAIVCALKPSRFRDVQTKAALGVNCYFLP